MSYHKVSLFHGVASGDFAACWISQLFQKGSDSTSAGKLQYLEVSQEEASFSLLKLGMR